MKKAKDKAVAAGKEALSMFTIQNYKREYNNIIKDAYGENPEPVKPKKKRGRVKRGKILALIDLPVFRKTRCSVRQQSS